MNHKIVNSEFVNWAKNVTFWNEDKFHAVLCDPPYGIAFMGKEWDDPGGPPAFQAQAKAWGDAMLPLLYPGALVFMFAGTRMWHRLAAGMEDAGFHLWDTLMWIHGQGFPKAQDISKLIDKTRGDARTNVVGRYQPPGMDNPWNLKNAKDERTVPLSASSRNNLYITAPATEISAPWVGHKTPQLKPAWEPILCFRAPNQGKKYVELVLQYGSGALNVDGARIGTTKNVPSSISRTAGVSLSGSVDRSLRKESGSEDGHNSNIGRYPANLAFDEVSAAALDEQTGVLTSGHFNGHRNKSKTKNAFGKFDLQDEAPGRETNSGGASRFFYVAKANTGERSAGLDGKNNHPTVKPIDLNRWLASLLLPPDTVKPRRLLVPFSGVASEMIGSIQAGWDEIVGVEMDAEYCKIAEARITYWKNQDK